MEPRNPLNLRSALTVNPQARSENCGNCDCFLSMRQAGNPLNLKDQPPGLCRRRPPIPVVITQAETSMQGTQVVMIRPPIIQAMFPQVPASEYCHEHIPKKAK